MWTFLLKGNSKQILIAFIPIFFFWILDGYFLKQERLYRSLYNWVIENRLNSAEKIFDMNVQLRFDEGICSTIKALISRTLLIFYLSMIIVVLIYIEFSKNYYI